MNYRLKAFFLFQAFFLSWTGISAPTLSEFERYEKGSKEAEEALIARLKKNFVLVQTLGATQGHLNRGTHSKGICAEGTFEVFDVAKKNPNVSKEILSKLAVGLYANPMKKAVRLRFANGRSVIGKDTDPDVRSLSFSVPLEEGKRQDFSMNSVAIFPIDSLTSFNLFLESGFAKGKAMAIAKAQNKTDAEVVKAGADALEAFMKVLSPEDLEGLQLTFKLAGEVTSEKAKNYRQNIYWSGTSFKQGHRDAIKQIVVPCDGVVSHEMPPNAGPEYLQTEFKDYVNSDQPPICFTFRLQILDADQMTLEGKTLDAWKWVENPTLDWDKAGAKSYPVGQLKVTPRSIYSAEKCYDPALAYYVEGNSLEEHKPLGRVNRGRTPVEIQSKDLRSKK